MRVKRIASALDAGRLTLLAQAEEVDYVVDLSKPMLGADVARPVFNDRGFQLSGCTTGAANEVVMVMVRSTETEDVLTVRRDDDISFT